MLEAGSQRRLLHQATALTISRARRFAASLTTVPREKLDPRLSSVKFPASGFQEWLAIQIQLAAEQTAEAKDGFVARNRASPCS